MLRGQTLQEEFERSAVWRLFVPQSSLFWGQCLKLSNYQEVISELENQDLELESADEGGEVGLVLSQGSCSGETSKGRATSRTSWWNAKGHLIPR